MRFTAPPDRTLVSRWAQSGRGRAQSSAEESRLVTAEKLPDPSSPTHKEVCVPEETFCPKLRVRASGVHGQPAVRLRPPKQTVLLPGASESLFRTLSRPVPMSGRNPSAQSRLYGHPRAEAYIVGGGGGVRPGESHRDLRREAPRTERVNTSSLTT